MKNKKTDSTAGAPRYPGIPTAVDGSAAVVEMETAASEAAGAYPITPSTQMGEGWAAALAAGKKNVNGRKLIFFEPEGEHAAAAVTAGMSMTGLRATNFSSGQGIAYMHESLYPAVGKRLTYVLNIAARAMTKHALNVHAGHDDYHAVDDTGFFQFFAKNPQEIADLNLIAHRTAELSLNPGLCAQDGFLTSHVIESVRLPEREMIKEYLGDPSDIIDSPTPAQRLVFGEKRRRIPEMFDLDYPSMIGVVQNQDSYNQGVAAQRPFYFDHVLELTDQAMAEFEELTGRRYARIMGYRMDDAEYLIAGQGSVVSNAEVVCDYLRDERGLKIGVLNVTMFRPFPADLLSKALRGKKGVTVLERTDQPLAVDAPLVREMRAAMGKALENWRARGGEVPHAGIEPCAPDQIPEFYSGCFGLGSRDIQPGQIVAAVENMMEGGKKRRQFYLGIDFVRAGTQLPKLQIWQEKLLESYPDLAELALSSKEDLNLLPKNAISIRIHSVGGWGAITMGKNLAMTAADLFGLNIQANPKYGSEKKGQPTTFYATLAEEPLRLNCELMHVNAVLAPDPNVFRHSNPLAGMQENGVFIIQSDLPVEEFWNSLPGTAQRALKSKAVKVYLLDAFKIASAEASDPALRYRMQGAAFMGAFFHVSPLVERYGLEQDKLFEGIRAQLAKKFGHLGERVVEDNVRVIRRGFDEIREVDVEHLSSEKSDAGPVPQRPDALDGAGWRDGIGNPGRFWEQVCHLYKTGDDGIADPFAAISAIPAATSTIRDMTDVRFEVPEFIAEKCTGCGQCWVQCPDTAIPGVVTEVDQVIYAAINAISNGQSYDRLRQIVPHIARESRRIMQGISVKSYADIMSTAYKTVTDKLNLDPERRAALDAEFGPVYSTLADFPLAKTAPFFDVPEGNEKGSGGLLSITVNPETCKGCNICVDVCPDDALITIKQDENVVDKLRRNWRLWKHLPETDDRYISVSDIDEGIGVLSSLLLKKHNYRSMMGGDGSCMGCGEKTVIHLVLSAVNALMIPRVKKYVAKLDEMISKLDAKARNLLVAEADLDKVGNGEKGEVGIALEASKQGAIEHINKIIHQLKDLRWRYTEGPSGKGRSSLGMANATGCSSVWGSTYPYNPYPFPWANHLFQDAPSIAIGVFEGHMRKMADGFVAVRRAELELSDDYDPGIHEPFFAEFDWHHFNDEEFAMCPPIFAVGGDGAMLDIGFQNLSRLLASGKPIRVIVLDTQVYSNTGGQACTSGFLGQVSDMAAYGAGQHGKEEMRKELALIAMAHGRVFVLQSTQAAASHLIEGVLKGLQTRYPAVFGLHCPCPPEHGLGDDQATRASRLAMESRAYPILMYDPSGGDYISDQLSLDGNPSLDETWPSYEVTYVDENGDEKKLDLPVTIADWAATESRFQKHFKKVKGEVDPESLVLFHEYIALPPDEREEKTPIIYQIDDKQKLTRLMVSHEIVELAQDRLRVWSHLRQMAGLELAPDVRDGIEYDLEQEFNKKTEALQTEYSAKMAQLKARYPAIVARRLAEGLVRAGNGGQTVADLMARVQEMPIAPVTAEMAGEADLAVPVPSGAAASLSTDASTATAVAEAPAGAAVVEEAEEGLAMEPYIDSARCTTCDECTNLNNKLFAYNEKKQAYIKDARAGTFKQLVQAAEKCPVRIIHPGTPLNQKEKDLEKWVKRAEPFN